MKNLQYKTTTILNRIKLLADKTWAYVTLLSNNVSDDISSAEALLDQAVLSDACTAVSDAIDLHQEILDELESLKAQLEECEGYIETCGIAEDYAQMTRDSMFEGGM